MIALIVALALAVPPDTFPRDSTGHRYVEATRFGADSIIAARMVEMWKTRDHNGSSTFACLYGKPTRNERGELAVYITGVERAGTIDDVKTLDRCRASAIGFLAFGDGIYNAGNAAQALAGIVKRKPDWLVGAVVYGVVPVPPEEAKAMHIPMQVPSVFAVVYTKPPNKAQGDAQT